MTESVETDLTGLRPMLKSSLDGRNEAIIQITRKGDIERAREKEMKIVTVKGHREMNYRTRNSNRRRSIRSEYEHYRRYYNGYDDYDDNNNILICVELVTITIHG